MSPPGQFELGIVVDLHGWGQFMGVLSFQKLFSPFVNSVDVFVAGEEDVAVGHGPEHFRRHLLLVQLPLLRFYLLFSLQRVSQVFQRLEKFFVHLAHRVRREIPRHGGNAA